MTCGPAVLPARWIGASCLAALILLPATLRAEDLFVIHTLDAAGGFVGEHCAYTTDGLGYPFPHFCYVDGRTGALMYAGVLDAPSCCPPNGRTFEIIDPAGGEHTSIAVWYGLSGVWVSYARAGALWVASRSSGWTRTRVDSTGCVGAGTSIALDSGQNPHVSYWDCARGDLKYARRTGGAWAIETVDSLGEVGASSSIALDASGNPRISYRDATNGTLEFASKSAGVWTLSTVDADGFVGGGTSLWLDPSGNPRIAYLDTRAGADLRYAFRSGGAWLREWVDTSHDVGQRVSLEGDRIAYRDAALGDLKLATRSGGWSLESVDTEGDVGEYACLSPNGTTVGYFDRTRGEVKIAEKSGSNWSVRVVDDGHSVGLFADAATDAAGRLHVAYYDATWKDLKHAEWSAGSATVVTVDSAGSVGGTCSIAIDPAGDPWIAYRDADRSELKLARRTGASWEIEVVDTGVSGGFTDIAFGPGGAPHLAYSGALGLTHAERDEGAWRFERVDAAASDGSLAVGAGGEPRIAYSTWTALKFASRTGGTWETAVVDEDWTGMGEGFGLRPSLAIGGDGEPRIVYGVRMSLALDFGIRYAVRSAGVWSVEPVGPQFYGGAYPSLALHSSGVPLVAYLEYEGALRYAHRETGTWLLETVDIAGRPGVYGPAGCAIALDPLGRPHIAYHDLERSDLMLAAGTRTTGVGPARPERGSGIAGAWPSPWRRGEAMRVALALETGGAGRLELVDAMGRRVAARDLGELTAGPLVVTWSPAAPAPGVYFVRLVLSGRAAGRVRIVAIE